MRYGDKGADVKALQESLLSRGYRLPRYSADGHLGEETWGALEQYAKSELGVWDPEVPAGIEESFGSVPIPPAPDPITPPAESVVEVIDLRGEQTDPAPKSKVVSGSTVQRAPHTVTGIVLHQTGCTYGVSSQQVAAAGGDRALALHRRALNVACHAMAFRDGCVVLTNPVESYIYHGNGFNRYTLGAEIAGIYPGMVNDPQGTTWGGEPTELTPETIAAAREAVRQLLEMGRDVGMPITHIFTHRQSSDTRRSDCGEGLWRAVVTDYAVPVLGLKTEPSLVVGSGSPVPVEWDTYGSGHY